MGLVGGGFTLEEQGEQGKGFLTMILAQDSGEMQQESLPDSQQITQTGNSSF